MVNCSKLLFKPKPQLNFCIYLWIQMKYCVQMRFAHKWYKTFTSTRVSCDAENCTNISTIFKVVYYAKSSNYGNYLLGSAHCIVLCWCYFASEFVYFGLFGIIDLKTIQKKRAWFNPWLQQLSFRIDFIPLLAFKWIFNWNRNKMNANHLFLFSNYLALDLTNPRRLLLKSNNNETNFLCSRFIDCFIFTCWCNYHPPVFCSWKKQTNQNKAIILSSPWIRIIKHWTPEHFRQLIIFTVISTRIEMFSVSEHSQKRLIISSSGSFVNKQKQTIDSTISDNQLQEKNKRFFYYFLFVILSIAMNWISTISKEYKQTTNKWGTCSE